MDFSEQSGISPPHEAPLGKRHSRDSYVQYVAIDGLVEELFTDILTESKLLLLQKQLQRHEAEQLAKATGEVGEKKVVSEGDQSEAVLSESERKEKVTENKTDQNEGIEKIEQKEESEEKEGLTRSGEQETKKSNEVNELNEKERKKEQNEEEKEETEEQTDEDSDAESIIVGVSDLLEKYFSDNLELEEGISEEEKRKSVSLATVTYLDILQSGGYLDSLKRDLKQELVLRDNENIVLETERRPIPQAPIALRSRKRIPKNTEFLKKNKKKKVKNFKNSRVRSIKNLKLFRDSGSFQSSPENDKNKKSPEAKLAKGELPVKLRKSGRSKTKPARYHTQEYSSGSWKTQNNNNAWKKGVSQQQIKTTDLSYQIEEVKQTIQLDLSLDFQKGKKKEETRKYANTLSLSSSRGRREVHKEESERGEVETMKEEWKPISSPGMTRSNSQPLTRDKVTKLSDRTASAPGGSVISHSKKKSLGDDFSIGSGRSSINSKKDNLTVNNQKEEGASNTTNIEGGKVKQLFDGSGSFISHRKKRSLGDEFSIGSGRRSINNKRDNEILVTEQKDEAVKITSNNVAKSLEVTENKAIRRKSANKKDRVGVSGHEKDQQASGKRTEHSTTVIGKRSEPLSKKAEQLLEMKVDSEKGERPLKTTISNEKQEHKITTPVTSGESKLKVEQLAEAEKAKTTVENVDNKQKDKLPEIEISTEKVEQQKGTEPDAAKGSRVATRWEYIQRLKDKPETKFEEILQSRMNKRKKKKESLKLQRQLSMKSMIGGSIPLITYHKKFSVIAGKDETRKVEQKVECTSPKVVRIQRALSDSYFTSTKMKKKKKLFFDHGELQDKVDIKGKGRLMDSEDGNENWKEPNISKRARRNSTPSFFFLAGLRSSRSRSLPRPSFECLSTSTDRKEKRNARELRRMERSMKRKNFTSICNSISQNLSSLVYVDLSNHNLEAWDISGRFAVVMSNNTHITSLDLSHNSIGDAGMNSMNRILRTNSTLRHLNLQYNSLTIKGAGLLAYGLKRNIYLCNLEVTENPTIFGLLQHFPLITYAKSKFTVYTIANQFFDLSIKGEHDSVVLVKRDLSIFPPEITQLGHLINLNLSSNKITKIPADLSQLTKLVELDLSNNYIKEIPPQIVHLKSLERLILVGNHIESVPHSIALLPSLVFLDLRGNMIPNSDSFPYAALAVSPTLETLRMSGNPFEKENLIPEVILQSDEQLLSYLRFLVNKDAICCQTNIVVLGNRGVGKTSILKQLMRKENVTETVIFSKKREPIHVHKWIIVQTHKSLSVKSDDKTIVPRYNFYCWDFKGEFLKRHFPLKMMVQKSGIFLIVYDLRNSIQSCYKTLVKWFSMFSECCIDDNTFYGLDEEPVAKKPTVFVVGTYLDVFLKNHGKIEEHEDLARYMMAEYQGMQPRFVLGNGKTGWGVTFIRNAILQVAKTKNKFLPILGKLIALQQIIVGMSENHKEVQVIPFYEFKDLCCSLEIAEEDLDSALNYLIQLGRICYFADPELKDWVLISPMWIYRVFDSTICSYKLLKRGVIKHDFFSLLLHKKYDEELVDVLLNFMIKLNIIFPFSQGKKVLSSNASKLTNRTGKNIENPNNENRNGEKKKNKMRSDSDEIGESKRKGIHRKRQRKENAVSARIGKERKDYLVPLYIPKIYRLTKKRSPETTAILRASISLSGEAVEKMMKEALSEHNSDEEDQIDEIGTEKILNTYFSWIFGKLPGDVYLRNWVFSCLPPDFLPSLIVSVYRDLIEFSSDYHFDYWTYGMVIKSKGTEQNSEEYGLLEINPKKFNELNLIAKCQHWTLDSLLVKLLRTIDIVLAWYSDFLQQIRIPCSHCLKNGLFSTNNHYFTVPDCEEAVSSGLSYLECQQVESKTLAIRIDRIAPDITLEVANEFKINFNQVELHEKLGDGTQGSVYKAGLNDKIVAVKIFQKEDTSESQELLLGQFMDFRKEVMVMVGLQHKNIVSLRAICNDPFCIVTDYFPNGDLCKYLAKQQSRLSLDFITKIAIDIAEGMFFLHNCMPPICHSDLKSPNVLLVHSEESWREAREAKSKKSETQTKKKRYGLTSPRDNITQIKQKLRKCSPRKLKSSENKPNHQLSASAPFNSPTDPKPIDLKLAASAKYTGTDSSVNTNSCTKQNLIFSDYLNSSSDASTDVDDGNNSSVDKKNDRAEDSNNNNINKEDINTTRDKENNNKDGTKGDGEVEKDAQSVENSNKEQRRVDNIGKKDYYNQQLKNFAMSSTTTIIDQQFINNQDVTDQVRTGHGSDEINTLQKSLESSDEPDTLSSKKDKERKKHLKRTQEKVKVKYQNRRERKKTQRELKLMKHEAKKGKERTILGRGSKGKEKEDEYEKREEIEAKKKMETFYQNISLPPGIGKALHQLNHSFPEQTEDSIVVAKCADFGLATRTSMDNVVRQVDNPLWLAPEIMEGRPYTQKADIYSFGIVLNELFCRIVPFSDMDEQVQFGWQLEEKIISGGRPTMENDARYCPPAFSQLITKCWSSNPNLRPSFTFILEELYAIKNAYCSF